MMDPIQITPQGYLSGTRAVRVSEPDVTEGPVIGRDEAPLTDEEFELRQLRRTVAEQIIRKIRQIKDVEEASTAYNPGKEEKVWKQLFSDILSSQVENLWNPLNPTSKKINTLKIPSQWEDKEIGGLTKEIKRSRELIIQMTEILKQTNKQNGKDIRSLGGVRALFPDIAKDFSDVTAPHIDSYNKASTQGLKQLISEMRTGHDITAVQAVPRYFLATVSCNPSSSLIKKNSESKVKDMILESAESVFLNPPIGSVINFKRTNHGTGDDTKDSKYTASWIISLEKDRIQQQSEPEVSKNNFNKMTRKKRLQRLLMQKPVEEREAGGVRQLLQELEETFSKTKLNATSELHKLYVKGTILDGTVNWYEMAKQEKGPAMSPCGRAAIHKLMKKYSAEFILLSDPESRDSKRGMLAPFVPWLDQKTFSPSDNKQQSANSQQEPTDVPADQSDDTLKTLLKGSSTQTKRRRTTNTVTETLLLRASNKIVMKEQQSTSRKVTVSSKPNGFDPLTISLACIPGVHDCNGELLDKTKPPEEYFKSPGKRSNPFSEAEAALKRRGEGLADTLSKEDFTKQRAATLAKEEDKLKQNSIIFDPGFPIPEEGVSSLVDLYEILTTTSGSPLHPQGKRLHKASYTNPLLLEVLYSYSVKDFVLFSSSDWIYAGEVPIMIKSKDCMLYDKSKGDLASIYQEESREPGGYFIMKGNERVLRMVLVARGNHAITLERASFSTKGPSFTSKCVYVRSVRPSGIAVPNYLYMLSGGKIILSFSRGTTWQIPLSLILLSLNDKYTPLQLAEQMSSDSESDKWAAAFMGDIFNQVQLARYYTDIPSDTAGFPSSSGHWQYILGKFLCNHHKGWVKEILVRCRAKLSAGAFSSEVYRQVGMWVLHEHILPHLNDLQGVQNKSSERQRKLHTLLAMVKKLVMFQSGRLREEGEDGLVNQEIITPGQLWLHAVQDAILSVGRGLRSSLSILGLTDNKPREGWESLRPPTIDELLQLCSGPGGDKLRELTWKYFWMKKREPINWDEPPPWAKEESLLKPSNLIDLTDTGKDDKKPQKKTSKDKQSTEKELKYLKSVVNEWDMRYDLTVASGKSQKGSRQRVIGDPTYPVCFLVSTGNYTQEPLLANGSSLPQAAGWSVVVERINKFRFLEQFRATHRGKTIQEMRTTAPRRYQMDGWGFLCIVHTPDGGPCGVMNHLTYPTQVVIGLTSDERRDVISKVVSFLKKDGGGKLFSEGPHAQYGSDDWHPFSVDGELLGYVQSDYLRTSSMKNAGEGLRQLRANGTLSNQLEIVSVDPSWVNSEIAMTSVTKDKGDTHGSAPRMQPGLLLFTGPGRLSRPIKKLGSSLQAPDSLYWVGSKEQIFLNIAALHKDVGETPAVFKKDPGNVYKYVEVATTSALSLTASLIPYFEMNCSPRNLFQCGMAKQTMGSCFHSIVRRNDNKLYHTHGCQAALLKTDNQALYNMDDYPNGINVILAVAAYTGFDMEDALLINRNSIERGLFLGSVYLSTILEPFEDGKRKVSPHFVVIPQEGQYLKKGDVYAVSSDGKKESWAKPEPCRVHNVELLEMDPEESFPTRIRVTFRIQRTPVIGDKFAARHGQKGTLPMLVPQSEMPFCDNGVVPDVIINPHAFPSRMTVGMLIEMIAAKYAAVKGTYPDATAWSEISDQPIAARRMGDLLGQLGYSHTGGEMMTHGATGQKMSCDIYTGICYYQRLRHMVDDKYQARERADKASGVDPLTGQPVKGRKKGGGIRVGEMERDALIAHGTVQVGQDRLLKSSDLGVMRTCAACGATPCTCENGGTEQFRYAPKALEFMNSQLRTMGVALRTLPKNDQS